ncbi:type VI secretion system baseplate subunit TssE [Trinickia violacea]|uniref:Type VI secretion system baseplate subunit TssE n=1 Tax=Trinickia violacea TaxID=2571746 RepID=A0A4P8J1H3_9BURK|nr:type VI secretion system baseplate subunit TssE [Trinickia violacea]QCP53534.1 type VI secretion system baseplate subunit TssE [Trinickia violacea]
MPPAVRPDTPVAPVPLFERLEDDAPYSPDEPSVQSTLTPDELRDSVRAELVRLLNTRRGKTPAPGRRPLDVLHYGLPDWSASHAARPADRAALERDIVEAVTAFEPRLAQPQAQIEPDPDVPWRLRLRITGHLVSAAGRWPIAFVAPLADGQPVGVVDERIA